MAISKDLDTICALIEELQLPDATAEALLKSVQNYKKRRNYSHQTPAFKEVMDALENSAAHNLDIG
jgi:hypothetical protein